jgi:DNA processing protein
LGRTRPETASNAYDSGIGNLSDDEKLCWLRLIRTENVGPVTFYQLLAHFDNARAALEAIPGLRQQGGMRSPGLVCTEREAAREINMARRAGVRIVAFPEPDYPHLLKHIDAPPPILYMKGDCSLAARKCVAIVGSRSASGAGRQFAATLARDLGAAGVAVVSGLARGIDTAAHEAALNVGTIAVVGGGVDVIYPPENAALHAELGERGLIVSECPLGYSPRGQDFPRRNRIISGLSLGVVVVEAARHSGSLITARLAVEQNRDVFAVPGHPLDPRAAGTNNLIRSGARLITSADDVLAELPHDVRSQPEGSWGMRENTYAMEDDGGLWGGSGCDSADYVHSAPVSGGNVDAACGLPSAADHEKVLCALSIAPISADAIARATGLSASALAVALLELDIAGRIERHSNEGISLKTNADS